LNFTRGGSATLRLDKLDQERLVLDVTLGAPIAADRPFRGAALDVRYRGQLGCRAVGVRAKDAQSWTQTPVMDFKRGNVAELWAGRLAPSRHNTSAPDMVFGDFSSTAR
jgi:hypothetical protein